MSQGSIVSFGIHLLIFAKSGFVRKEILLWFGFLERYLKYKDIKVMHGFRLGFGSSCRGRRRPRQIYHHKKLVQIKLKIKT
jgi:hypothetical protein